MQPHDRVNFGGLVSRAACSRPVRIGAFLLALLFPS